MSPFQAGFRQHHSTESAVIYFTDEIRRSAESGKLTGALFIDLRKASDSVPHNPMTKKARSCWLSWLFHAFLPLKSLEKAGKARKFLAFLESLEWYSKKSLESQEVTLGFQGKPGI